MQVTCECLYDKIAISSVCDENGDCNFYVDDLPGIERDSFEYLTTQNVRLGNEIWARVQRRAIRRFIQDFEVALSDKFQVRPIVSDVITGVWDTPHQAIALENEWRGYEINLLHSENVGAYIDHVELYAGNVSDPISSEIRVYDLYTGEVLFTKAFSVSANGFFTVDIEQTFYSDRIFVCYDASAIQSYDVEPNPMHYYEDVCRACACTVTRSQCASIAKQGEDILWRNINHTCNGGMIVTYAIHCSLEPFICRNKSKVLPVLWYLMALEFFTEVAASKRINELTLIDSETLDSLAGYANTHYKNGLKSLGKTIKIQDAVCVECISRVKQVSIIN